MSTENKAGPAAQPEIDTFEDDIPELPPTVNGGNGKARPTAEESERTLVTPAQNAETILALNAADRIERRALQIIRDSERVLKIEEEVRRIQARDTAREKAQTRADPLATVISCRALHAAEMPPRVWFIEGIFTPGFNLITGRKALKKSWLVQGAGDAISDGFPWVGRRTRQAKVLWVSFELDEGDLHSRLQTAKHQSDNMDIVFSWPSGDQGLQLAERAIVEKGYQVDHLRHIPAADPARRDLQDQRVRRHDVLPEVALAREKAWGCYRRDLARGQDAAGRLHADRLW